jgi:large subunit ribosomal protein L20
MTRVKRGVISHKRRERLLKYAKGFRWGRKSKERLAREALLHAWTYSFQGRKKKKGDFRKLWQAKISAALSGQNLPYNKFIHGLKQKKVELDRKILAQLAEHEPKVFEKIIEMAK